MAESGRAFQSEVLDALDHLGRRLKKLEEKIEELLDAEPADEGSGMPPIVDHLIRTPLGAKLYQALGDEGRVNKLLGKLDGFLSRE